MGRTHTLIIRHKIIVIELFQYYKIFSFNLILKLFKYSFCLVATWKKILALVMYVQN